MIFVRYNGADKSLGFTEGKVYVAMPEMESQDAVQFGFIEVVNDHSEKIKVRPVKGDDGETRYGFEFLEEVYAVVAKEFEGFKVGQVVVVDNAFSWDTKSSPQKALPDFPGDYLEYNVKGLGRKGADYMILLDRTNVFPGLVVLDESKGSWEKVRCVDECLWISLEGGPRRSPEEFRFAVSGGEIMVEPLVVCIDATGAAGLTQGRRYYLIREDGRGQWFVKDDRGLEWGYFSERFKMG